MSRHTRTSRRATCPAASGKFYLAPAASVGRFHTVAGIFKPGPVASTRWPHPVAGQSKPSPVAGLSKPSPVGAAYRPGERVA